MDRDWFRQALVSLLREFTSVDPDAPIDDLANIWANHLYVPGVGWAAYLPDVHAEVVAQFQSSFAHAELETLEQFNQFVVSMGSAEDEIRRVQLANAAQDALKAFLN